MTVADPNKDRADLLPSILFGLVAGAVFGLLAYAASRTTIGGPSWSLSGNGSLVILFAGSGAALAGGWFALAERARGNPAWRTRAVLAALAIFVLELAFGFAPVLLAGALASAGAQLILVGLLVVLALTVGVALAGGGLRAGQITALLALLLTLPTFGLAALLLPLFLPLTMAMPALSLARGAWLAANCLALLLALVAGVFASQILTNR
jgi:hypothetical protein